MGKLRHAATSDQAVAQLEGSRRSCVSRKLRNRIRRSWQGRDRGRGRKSAADACFGAAAGLALKLGTIPAKRPFEWRRSFSSLPAVVSIGRRNTKVEPD